MPKTAISSAGNGPIFTKKLERPVCLPHLTLTAGGESWQNRRDNSLLKGTVLCCGGTIIGDNEGPYCRGPAGAFAAFIDQ